MKYELITKHTKGGARKVAKAAKKKATRLASKRITFLHKRGDDYRAEMINPDPRQGWAD